MERLYSVSRRTARGDRTERVLMAESLRGEDAIAGLTTPDIRRAIARARRRVGTKEKERSARFYTMGPAVAELCLRLLFWEGKNRDERGVHKSFAELERETGGTKRRLQTARQVAEEEGLLTATVGFRPDAERQRTLWWRLDLWRLHEVVFEGALEETRTKLEAGGRARELEKLRERRDALEAALSDLRLCFLDGNEEPGEERSEPQTEEASRVEVSTTCNDGDDRLYRLHGGTQEGREKGTRVPLKKDPDGLGLAAPKQEPKKLGVLTDAEAEERWEELVATSSHGRALMRLAQMMAEYNKTKKVAISRAWRTLGNGFVRWHEKLDLDEDSWAHGFWAAIAAEAPSVGYVRKAAQSYDRRQGGDGSGREPSRPRIFVEFDIQE